MAAAAVNSSRHVLIYGPPAAGKLSVAESLAARSGFRVLDNHASVDPALRLFDFGTPEFSDLVEALRVDLLRAASAAGVDVVSTLVFAHPVDRDHVARLVAATRTGGGEVSFVQLRPSREVLEQRVLGASRANTRKVTDLATLRAMLDRYDLTTPINADDLAIDNSDRSPEAVALDISRHLGLDQ